MEIFCCPVHGPCTPTTVSDVTGGGSAYVNKLALLHCVETPKQKQLMQSSGRLALSLNCPFLQTSSSPPDTFRIVSGTTNSVPWLLSNSHEYAPESETSIFGHVNTPNPFWLVLIHFSGTWPQFKRHNTNGVGTPTALQVMLNVSPGRKYTSGGGGWDATGFVQPTSSDPSKQSTCESHSNDFGMHWPLWHWYSLPKQIEPGAAVAQPSSSELSSQSSSPSEKLRNLFNNSKSDDVRFFVFHMPMLMMMMICICCLKNLPHRHVFRTHLPLLHLNSFGWQRSNTLQLDSSDPSLQS